MDESSEQYRRLKARRTGLKASITRQLNQLENLAKAMKIKDCLCKLRLKTSEKI